MWAILAKLLTSRAGVIGLVAAGVLALVGVQELRIKLAERGEASAKASAAAAQGRLTASETNRASEYRQAAQGLSEAERACADRVAQAVRSGAAIRRIVEKPIALDPKTRCPVRALVGAGELRDALGQPAPGPAAAGDLRQGP